MNAKQRQRFWCGKLAVVGIPTTRALIVVEIPTMSLPGPLGPKVLSNSVFSNCFSPHHDSLRGLVVSNAGSEALRHGPRQQERA